METKCVQTFYVFGVSCSPFRTAYHGYTGNPKLMDIFKNINTEIQNYEHGNVNTTVCLKPVFSR